ncbi:MAG: hypothetical protein PHC64_01765 [Candidatus Gastranaerophilales bacterium]|nr:hypothetical protein [Candidatus Gastranaerophilales bacterium]
MSEKINSTSLLGYTGSPVKKPEKPTEASAFLAMGTPDNPLITNGSGSQPNSVFAASNNA